MENSLKKSNKLFIIAGDYSGDKHAAGVVRELKSLSPDIIIEGVGGINLQKAGVKLLFDQKNMNKMGLTPSSILSHYLMGKKIINYLKNVFNPDLVLLVDYGAFNLAISKELKKADIKTFYFIPPQIWASRKWRIKTIKKNIDKVFTIFPFEKEFYEKEGINSVYVGHPLIKQLPPPVNKREFFERHNLDSDKKLVGVFPGSRPFEIKYLFKTFEHAVKLIEKKIPDVQFVFSLSENLPDNIYKTNYKVIKGENYALLSASDALILASGTVALEASFYKTPMIISYKGPLLFYLVYLLVRTIKKACLVNIITNKDVVPELLMYNSTGEKISDEIIKILQNDSVRQKQIKGLEETKRLLSDVCCVEVVAKEIFKEFING